MEGSLAMTLIWFEESQDFLNGGVYIYIYHYYYIALVRDLQRLN